MAIQFGVMQEERRKENLRRFRITWSDRFILVEAESTAYKTQILIDKRRPKPKIVFENTNKAFEFEQESQSKECSLILGVLLIKNQQFLIYAESVYKQSLLPPVGYSIYQIANIGYIPFSHKTHKDEETILESLQKEIFNFSFYFSFERDLTLRSDLFYSHGSHKPVSKFFWNESMLRSMMEGKLHEEWCTPVIQGHYSKFESFIGQTKITYCLLSRRCKERSGTRFYSRGIDESGNCSNTVETEQIVLFGKYLLSTVFVSGSTPIFWEQRSQTSQVKLTRNKELTKGPYLEHLSGLNSEYGNLILVNLLEKKKESESLLLKAYEQIFLETEGDTCVFSRYVYFDINEALKQNNSAAIVGIILQVDEVLQNFGCLVYDLEDEKIIERQKGIFRVSCLDCLNRTNVFLQALSIRVLELQLQIAGIADLRYLQDLLQKPDDQLDPMIKNFKECWSEKADYESLIYAGTRAASGRKDKFLDELDNSFISIQRLYNEKFMDRLKQTAIDLIHSSSKDRFSQNHQKYTSPLKISIVTWNVNATEPSKLELGSICKHLVGADIVAFGLQQIMDLHPKDVMMEDEESEIAQLWEKQICKTVNELSAAQGKKFIAIQRIEMVGLFLILLINQQWKNTLRSVHTDSVKTGMGGTFGNKGGLSLQLRIFDTSICFTCSHLAAGGSKVKERVDDFTQIHKKAFQQNKSGVSNQGKIEDCDHKFFFGDLNFRIKGEFKDFAELLEIAKDPASSNYVSRMERFIDEFSGKDQLYELRTSSETPFHLASYSEEPVRFPPTYKLEKHTGFYTLEKSRNPSWCDRILYWSDDLENHTCECDLYTSLPVIGSDHRPVLGKFTVSILKQEPRAEDTDLTGAGKEFRDTLRESPNDPCDINLMDSRGSQM